MSDLRIRRAFALLASVFIFASVPSAQAFWENKPHQFTLGANYNLNSQNPFGDFPVLSINLTLTPSVIVEDTHEGGVNLGYTGTKQSNTITNTSTTTSQFNIGPYYRYNFTLTEKGAKMPIIAYAGPQFGLTVISVPTATGKTASSTNFSVGGQFGLNFLFTKNLAVNFHAFQWDTVFATKTQLLITQSLGIRYYFQ